VSNHYAWQLAVMLGAADRHGLASPVSNQVCYNVLDRPVETETVPFCRTFGIPIMAYSPLCSGLLTGKYRRGEPLPPGSAIATRYRGQIRAMHETDVVHDVLEGLAQIVAEQALSMIQLSLLWVMAKPYVGAVIIGGTRPEHFGPAFEIADRTLPADVVARIDALSEPRIYKPFRNQPFNMGAARTEM
jgi:aryl-alcohol dehydrogenase-like predicted oxidoreductase